MNHPKVSIIILNWNGLEDTAECLESLMKITYPTYEVIVVDNASEGDDVRILRERFGDYIHVIVNDRNYGFAKGSNVGIRYALDSNADYVLLLNNDTVVHPDFLSELVKDALVDKSIGIVGPTMYYYDQPEKACASAHFVDYWAGNLFARRRGQIDIEQVEDTVEVDCVSGFCILISRDVLLSAGLLDPRFFFGYDDVDICIRAAKRGFRVLFVPRSKVWHKISTRLAFREKKSSSYALYADSLVRSRFLLMRKHWSKPQFVVSSLCYIASWPKLFVDYLLYYRQWGMLRGFIRGVLGSVRRKA